MTDKNTISIIHQNIRSMRANFDYFIAEITSLQIYPDLIVLTEIWIKNNETIFYKIPNYNLLVSTNENQRAGGVAIYVKNDIFQEVECNNINFMTADILQINCKFCGTLFEVLAVYRLHNYTINSFVDELDIYLTTLLKQTNNLIVMGDLNIDLMNLMNFDIDRYRIVMASNGLESLCNVPTRVTEVSETCIDHLFVRLLNKSMVKCNAEVIKTQVSDHFMVVLRMCVTGEGGGRTADCADFPPKAAVKYRLCYDKLNNLLDTVDWSEIYKQSNACIAYDMFEHQLLKCIDASKVECKLPRKYKKLKPWMTNHICKLIQKRNNLYKKVKNRTSDIKLKSYYVNFRNKVRNSIKSVKLNYYKRKFSETSNTRAVWDTVNEITGQNIGKQPISLLINDEMVHDSKQIANEFNKYFLTVANKIGVSNIVPGNFQNLKYKNVYPQYTESKSIFIDPALPEDVVKIINSLKNGKSPGVDGISSTLLKHIYPGILEVFTFIINLSLSTGVFPDSLKKAVVIPIYKSGKSSTCSNFRPISLISTFAKLLEKIMKEKLLKFLNNNGFFSKNQYGFRSGLNTETALLDFTTNLANGINNGKCVSGLFLDIKKAFDTVNHTILLDKLNNCGVRGVALNWFTSYLDKRRQCVKVEDKFSDYGEVNCGVPQGSVLGALLFIIFINDLCGASLNGNVTTFADDTALCYVGNAWSDLENSINSDMEALCWWFSKNKLALSTEKTTYINFSLRGKIRFSKPILFKCLSCLSENVICNECTEIKSNDNIKYLGIILDSEMNWKLHLLKTKNKLISSIRLFYFLNKICPRNVLRSLYFALVQSRLEYGIICWGGTYKSSLMQLLTLQKMYIRVILRKSKFTHAFPCFCNLRILPLQSLYVYKVLNVFYLRSRALHSNQMLYRTKLRRADDFAVPKPSTTFYTKTFDFIAPRTFNKLPYQIKTIQNYKLFKNRLLKWLFEIEDVSFLLSIQT